MCGQLGTPQWQRSGLTFKIFGQQRTITLERLGSESSKLVRVGQRDPEVNAAASASVGVKSR